MINFMNNFKKIFLTIFIIAFFNQSNSFAETVKEVEVVGNERISSEISLS